MRVSRLFGETRREEVDAEFKSADLLVRAGYVRQVGAGIFTLLPLGWRSIRKIERVIREEIDAIGGQEMSMPVVQPAELWERTGRLNSIDETLVRFTDRADRAHVLAMTHEEAVALHAASEISSYRQLPALIYQFQTKFRDELRSRGGLIRVREFLMKDSYSLDKDYDGLDKQYEAHRMAYNRIFDRLGLPCIEVQSDSGVMGGGFAHEYQYLTEVGEDSLAICDGCGYSANAEVAICSHQFPPAGETLKDLEKVATPECPTIESLAEFLGIGADGTAKMVFLSASLADGKQKLIAAVVRGDMELSEAKLRQLTGMSCVEAADELMIEDAGMSPGYASPLGADRSKMLVVVDELVAMSKNLVSGANEAGYHLKNVNCGRDYKPDITGDIAQVKEGDDCPVCGQPLQLKRGVEVGNIFKLGTKYSEAMEAFYNSENGQRELIVMGSYGIGVGRVLACIAQQHNDEHGLTLPLAVAPYAVQLLAVGKGEDVASTAEKWYLKLTEAGIEVLFDDRKLSPGVKFNDADLRGMPLRVTVSDRTLKEDSMELKPRKGDKRLVPLADGMEEIKEEIARL